MPKVTHVKKARKDYPEFGVAKGESYFYWHNLRRVNTPQGVKFKSTKRVSKTAPRPSQLVNSPFLRDFYQIRECIQDVWMLTQAGLKTCDDLRELCEDWSVAVGSLREEVETAFDALPDSLKESPTGVLLQTRLETLDAWQSDLDANTEADLDDSPQHLIDAVQSSIPEIE